MLYIGTAHLQAHIRIITDCPYRTHTHIHTHTHTYTQEAEQLISRKIHPQTIIAGWRKAVDCAREALTTFARDNSGDKEKFEEVHVVRGTMWL